MTKMQLLKKAEQICATVYKSWTVARIEHEVLDRQNNLLKQIDDVIDHHETFGRSYFWSPPGSASGRRAMEKKENFDVSFTYDRVFYKYESIVSCSCKNFYYTGTFSVDGEQKDLRSWRKVRNTIAASKIITKVNVLTDAMEGRR